MSGVIDIESFFNVIDLFLSVVTPFPLRAPSDFSLEHPKGLHYALYFCIMYINYPPCVSCHDNNAFKYMVKS